ncbi:MAG: hypothetical protein V4612_04965 [Pseudomonadota bacterium]
MTEGTSFADKYASKSKNNLSQLIKEKQEQKMTTEAVSISPSFGNKNPAIDNTKASKADLIYLVKGVDDNRNAWYYVLVERLKLSLFLKALNDDIIHLENYGEILYSAYGDEPPQDITDKLKKEYDIK